MTVIAIKPKVLCDTIPGVLTTCRLIRPHSFLQPWSSDSDRRPHTQHLHSGVCCVSHTGLGQYTALAPSRAAPSILSCLHGPAEHLGSLPETSGFSPILLF